MLPRDNMPSDSRGSPAETGSDTAGASRIESLIGRMSLEEKAGQLTIMPAAFVDSAAIAANPEAQQTSVEAQVEAVRAGRLGALFNGSNAAWNRQMQEIAVSESRLGIPLLLAADVIHGFRTIFPVPLAEAASFDADLAERTARAAAVEASAAGLAWNFAPMVDIARDARWGRGVEGAGEDVLLGNHLAAARVRGFQGPNGLADAEAMVATPKHLAGYGAALGGLDYNSVDISERTLRETYFPPFQAAFEAGAKAAMAAFNDINGVPAHANPWLLQTVLRQQWRFDGLVVSDYTGDFELIAHGVAADGREAAKLALLAGVDMSMASGLYAEHVPDLVRSGAVPEAVVDAAVRRVLELKQRLGLFDDPFGRFERGATEAPLHRPLAREAARRSIVMLRNQGGLLPLPRAGRKIALIGPFAKGPAHLNGPWVLFGDPADAISIEQGIRDALADPEDLVVVPGCVPEAAIPGGIEEAVAAARAANIVLLAIGEAETMSGEAQSRVEIDIPAPQRALAEAVAAIGKPVVILLKNGRPLVLDGAVAGSDAILITWFLGTETGHAIADILFGAEGPSGRLPVSFPQATGQSPYFYDHKNTGRPTLTHQPGEEFKARYREALNRAAFPFGFGLTYGDIRYDALDAGDGKLAWTGELRVAATIRNAGARDATELVQLYIRDRVASTTRPVRQLKAFRHVSLAPGAAERVEFTLRREDLLFIGGDLDWTVEPGLFDLWIGPSAEAGLHGTFELLPA